MAINFNNALGIHQHALSVRTQRAEVLAGNLANAETPNYKARDIDFRAAMQRQIEGTATPGLSMNTTSGAHVQGGAVIRDDGNSLFRVPTQASIDGNTVEEHTEHAEYMKNSLDFQSSFTFLNGKFKGLTSAIRGE